MEKRKAKISIGTAGGTAGKGAKTYKLTIPSSWIASMGITEDDRDVELSFDGDTIVVARPMALSQFARKTKGHDVKTVLYRDGQTVCTRISADFSDKTVCMENYTDDLVKTAFGKNTMPTWEDFMAFLEERCVPRERAGIREYLEVLGLDAYDPLEIVMRTQGRMAEDDQWIEVL